MRLSSPAPLMFASLMLGLVGCPKSAPSPSPGEAPGSDAAPPHSSSLQPDVDAVAADTDGPPDDDVAPGDDRHPIPATPKHDGTARVVDLEATPRAKKGGSCSPGPKGIDDGDLWKDDPECARKAKTWSEIPGTDRACSKAADCKLTELYCMDVPMNAKALTKKKYQGGPCWPPAMGQCNDERERPDVACVQGCCVVAGGDEDAHVEKIRSLLRVRLDNAMRTCGVKDLDGPRELSFTYQDGPIAWTDAQLAPFGDAAAACLGKVLSRLVKSDRTETGYVFDVSAKFE